ncbi:glycosyltransferase family 4 protein [Candidatus Falkowbacteria bacterium]|nr:glycosyltransferase family 4 protein [Candidatus Falkowbacteria bacterium]
MKTLLLTLEYPPFHGGVANYYGNLVKYWPASAKASAGKPDGIFVLKDNLINQALPFLKWLPAYFALRQKIKQEKIEQVIVGQILPLGLVAWLGSRFFKIKYSVILHGLDFSFALKSWRKITAAKLILNQAHKIIVINNYTAGLVKAFLGAGAEGKIIVVNPGVDQKNFQLRKKNNLENKIILLSVGRLVKRKGFDKVTDALPEVLRKIPNLVYVIIGNEAELKNSQFKNAIVINDALDAERDAWYQACDIFIMPARNIDGDYEGFGIVYLEANLAGKPVIAGKSGGVPDAVIDGLNGLMVDPEDVGEISQAIIKLAQNPDLRQKLGERGRTRAINEFNWEKQINKIYQFLNNEHHSCHCEERSDEAISG